MMFDDFCWRILTWQDCPVWIIVNLFGSIWFTPLRDGVEHAETLYQNHPTLINDHQLTSVEMNTQMAQVFCCFAAPAYAFSAWGDGGLQWPALSIGLIGPPDFLAKLRFG